MRRAFETLLAPSAGFCSGVRRAVALAERLLAQGPLVTLGPLIHNPQELKRLRALGLEELQGQAGAGERVLVRSHGATAEELERLRARGPLADATCPHVRACQKRAERMAARGYLVLVVGEPGHPETESILSFARRGMNLGAPPPRVVPAPADLPALERAKGQRVAVLAQTTQRVERLAEVVRACLERFSEVRAFNTICGATLRRQAEALELARHTDLVLVVGGPGSANTARLVEVCATLQPRTRQIETAAELDPRWLEGCAKVGVTAGASTPSRVIDEVLARLEELSRSMDDGGDFTLAG